MLKARNQNPTSKNDRIREYTTLIMLNYLPARLDLVNKVPPIKQFLELKEKSSLKTVSSKFKTTTT